MSRKSAPRKSAKPTPPKVDTSAKTDAVAPPTSPPAEKPAPASAPAPRKAQRDLSPTVPAGYKPQGKVRTLAEKGGVRVVSDDVRTWKEQA